MLQVHSQGSKDRHHNVSQIVMVFLNWDHELVSIFTNFTIIWTFRTRQCRSEESSYIVGTQSLWTLHSTKDASSCWLATQCRYSFTLETYKFRWRLLKWGSKQTKILGWVHLAKLRFLPRFDVTLYDCTLLQWLLQQVCTDEHAKRGTQVPQ